MYRKIKKFTSSSLVLSTCFPNSTKYTVGFRYPISSRFQWNVYCPQRVFHRRVAPDVDILIVAYTAVHRWLEEKRHTRTDRSGHGARRRRALRPGDWLHTAQMRSTIELLILFYVVSDCTRLPSEVTFYWTYTAPTGYHWQ